MYGRGISYSTYQFMWLLVIFVPIFMFIAFLSTTLFKWIIIILLILAVLYSVITYIRWFDDWIQNRNKARLRGAIVLVNDDDNKEIWVYKDKIVCENKEIPMGNIYKLEIVNYVTVQLYNQNDRLYLASFNFYEKPGNKGRFIAAVTKAANLEYHWSNTYRKKN